MKTFIFAFSSLSKRRGWGCILSYADDGVVRDQKPIHLPVFADLGRRAVALFPEGVRKEAIVTSILEMRKWRSREV